MWKLQASNEVNNKVLLSPEVSQVIPEISCLLELLQVSCPASWAPKQVEEPPSLSLTLLAIYLLWVSGRARELGEVSPLGCFYHHSRLIT